MDEPIRFGLIGAGGIAQSYLRALEDCSFARIVGVADVRASAAQAAAEIAGCKSYDSHEELADRTECDGAIICTTPSTHAEIALHFLERGIPVLCEKPLSTDVASAQMLRQAAERQGVTLTMASKYRYVVDVIRAKAIITSGILGDIIQLENTFTARIDMTKRWNARPGISGGGVLIDNGTHSVDIIRYLLGPIDEVMVVEGKKFQNIPVEDNVCLFARTGDGITARVGLTWSYNAERDSFIDIYGTHGTVSVGWRESKFRQCASPDWVAFGQGYDKVAAFRAQLENFCKGINGIEPLLVTADDAVASVEVIEAAYRSLSDGGWVPVSSTSKAKTSSETSTKIEETV